MKKTLFAILVCGVIFIIGDSMIDVREYRMTDYFEVNRIIKEAFDVEKANVNPDDNYTELVGVVDDKVVGYLVLTRVLDLIKGKTILTAIIVAVLDCAIAAVKEIGE